MAAAAAAVAAAASASCECAAAAAGRWVVRSRQQAGAQQAAVTRHGGPARNSSAFSIAKSLAPLISLAACSCLARSTSFCGISLFSSFGPIEPPFASTCPPTVQASATSPTVARAGGNAQEN
eukprot:1508814-Prymnesium_polylepis.1